MGWVRSARTGRNFLFYRSFPQTPKHIGFPSGCDPLRSEYKMLTMDTERQKAIYALYVAPQAQRFHIVWEYRYNEGAMDCLMDDKNLEEEPEWEEAPWREMRWEIWYEADRIYREEASDRETGFLILRDGSTFQYQKKERSPLQPLPGPLRIHDWLARHTLLKPRCLLVSHDIRWVGIEVKLGRTAFHVEARSEGLDDVCCFDAWFWSNAEKYHLWIDEETGILLQYAAEVRGTTIAIAEVRQLEMDFPEDMFPELL